MKTKYDHMNPKLQLFGKNEFERKKKRYTNTQIVSNLIHQNELNFLKQKRENLDGFFLFLFLPTKSDSDKNTKNRRNEFF